MSSPALRLQDVRRTFTQGEKTLDVLRGCTLSIERGEKVALLGPSGSGKSTLLQIAGLLEKPDEGDIFIDGKKASELGEEGRTELRRKAIGFVYQYHHLLPEFSAQENIILPQMIAGVERKAAQQRANDLLSLVQLSHRATHRPAQLSGGEQQRVALARALANRPALLIADEPTGNLDPHTAETVFSLLGDLAAREGLGLLMATHNHALAARMDRAYTLSEGLLL